MSEPTDDTEAPDHYPDDDAEDSGPDDFFIDILTGNKERPSPINVAEMDVAMRDPKAGERVLDCSSGTGTVLAVCAGHLFNRHRAGLGTTPEEASAEQLRKAQEQTAACHEKADPRSRDQAPWKVSTRKRFSYARLCQSIGSKRSRACTPSGESPSSPTAATRPSASPRNSSCLVRRPSSAKTASKKLNQVQFARPARAPAKQA